MFFLAGLVDDEWYEGDRDDRVLLLFDGKGRGSTASNALVDDGVFGELVKSLRH